ncbi:MAG: MoxR family ATPase [Pyrinomonadaceae bacterium]|nr:MoxR family ATPase [Pyrinomonadaceae bacterium]
MRDWIPENEEGAGAAVGAPANHSESLNRLIGEIGKVIKGKDDIIKLALVALVARGHLLIEDVPGIGKTTLANALAKSLDLSFQRIQFTSDLLPSDVIGISVFNQQTGEFEWKQGPIFANIVLADEINRATPKTQSSLLEAMAEEQVTSEGLTRNLPNPFMVVATQNPAEHHGTYPLPESQLDRFMLRLHVGYPSAAQERQIILDRAMKDPIDTIQKVLSQGDLIAAQESAASVTVDDALIDYLLKIVELTRQNPAVELGVSPRGALSLISSAKALAAIEGREYCIADDIKRLVLPCFAHRIVVSSASSKLNRRSQEANKILKQIMQSVEVPV